MCLRNRFEMYRLIAVNTICLLILFITQIANSSANIVSFANLESPDKLVLLEISSAEISCDVDEDSGEPDCNFIVCSNLGLSNTSAFHTFMYDEDKGLHILNSRIFIFNIALPPPGCSF